MRTRTVKRSEIEAAENRLDAEYYLPPIDRQWNNQGFLVATTEKLTEVFGDPQFCADSDYPDGYALVWYDPEKGFAIYGDGGEKGTEWRVSGYDQKALLSASLLLGT